MMTLEQINSNTTFLLILFGGFAVTEFLYDHYKYKNRDYKEAFANIGVAAIARTLGGTFTQAFMLGALLYISQFSLFETPDLSGLELFIIGVLCADLSYFLAHYAKHKIKFFWAIHSVHHSSPEFNLLTAIRLNGLSPIVDIPFYAWAVLLGVPAEMLVGGRIFLHVTQFFIHTQKIGSLGFIDLIFNTPRNHIIHHSEELENRDKNFGALFMIWDHLFGTYKAYNPENPPKKFGVSVPVNSYNPFRIYLHEFILWFRPKN